MRLQELVLRQCLQLKSLPDSFGSLSSLQQLNMTDLIFRACPACLAVLAD